MRDKQKCFEIETHARGPTNEEVGAQATKFKRRKKKKKRAET